MLQQFKATTLKKCILIAYYNIYYSKLFYYNLL